MFVNVNAAARHVEMVEAFGLPENLQRYYPEVFGAYHVNDDTCYWEFSPITNVWDVKVCGNYDLRDCEQTVEKCSFWTEEERLDIEEKLRSLAFLPRPSTPKNPGNWRSRPQFVYEGWVFSWKFNQRESRWQLEPMGRP